MSKNIYVAEVHLDGEKLAEKQFATEQEAKNWEIKIREDLNKHLHIFTIGYQAMEIDLGQEETQ